MFTFSIPVFFLPRMAARRLIAVLCAACWSLAPGAAQAQPAASPQAAAAGRAPAFAIYEYVVDGNTLLSEAAIGDSMEPYLGEDKNLQDVEGARAALEQAYHAAGYLTVLVSIPEQSVDSGAVSLHVVEAGVDKLRVRGAQYTLPSEIKAQIPELAEGKVPNFNTVQEQLAAVNRGANVRVTPILRAGTVPGTVEVQLDADDQLPLHGSVDYSNRQTPNTTPQRLSTSLRYENLWQRGHSLSLTAQVSPQRATDARVLAGNYLFPVGSSGGALMISGVHSRSEFASLANSPGLGLLGNSDILGLRYSLPLGSSASFSHSLSAGVDHKRIGQDLLTQGGGVSNDIHYSPAVLNYSARSMEAARSTTLELVTTAGLRGVLANRDAAFNAKRLGASASFVALRTTLAHTENLGRWSLFGRLDGQLASGPLVSSEQYTAGGADSVRGYLEGERAADAGLRLNLEVHTPTLKPFGSVSAWSLSGLVFVDYAHLTVLQPLAPQPAHQSLRGTGFGLRLAAPRGLALELDAAKALADGDTTKSGDKRVHARALWGF